MKKITSYDLAVLDYDGKVINVLRQFYKTNSRWSCIGVPKKCHLLSFYCGMDAEYKSKDGRVFAVKDGSIVITSCGSEYSVNFYPKSGGGEGVGINFHLFSDGEDVAFLDDIMVFEDESKIMERLFNRAEENYMRSGSPVLQKSSLFRILSAIGEGVAESREENLLILPGVKYLREHFAENFSLSELASLCHISDVYFRRLFLLQFGMSPAAYRISLRIKRAKEYLAYTNMPISEVSELLGYGDSAFFIRQFKKVTGATPLAYRMAYSR